MESLRLSECPQHAHDSPDDLVAPPSTNSDPPGGRQAVNSRGDNCRGFAEATTSSNSAVQRLTIVERNCCHGDGVDASSSPAATASRARESSTRADETARGQDRRPGPPVGGAAQVAHPKPTRLVDVLVQWKSEETVAFYGLCPIKVGNLVQGTLV